MSTSIGQKIRELRNKEGLSQQALADIIDVTKSTIYTWEKGTARPSRELNKLTEHPRFKKYASWLLLDDDVAQEPPAHYVAEKFDRLPPAKQRALLEYMDFLLAQQEKDKT